jgi:MFS family permease
MGYLIRIYEHLKKSPKRELNFRGKTLIQLRNVLFAMWRMGFFFHEMAFGLLSVFIPLYVVLQLHGTLVELGIMTAAALFCGIPASFFWGYICDRTRRYKIYILLSFISGSIILFAFTFATSVFVFIVLFVVLQILHVAHESPKNVLISEQFSREKWEKAYATYEGFTEVGWFIGLLLGLFTAIFAINSTLTLYLCSGLNLVAFILSIFLVADPLMIFERRLVGIERRIDFTYRGVENASEWMDGYSPDGVVKQESFLVFGVALMFFMLATSIFFTPLPIFFETAPQLQFSNTMVFLVYMLNSAGAMIGYFVAGRKSVFSNAKKNMRRIVFLRGSLIFLLVAVVELAVSPSFFAGIILVSLGFAYAVYYILTLALSMELLPPGHNAVFDVLVGLGAASGSFLGPYFAETIGYTTTFLIAGGLFFVALVLIWLSTRN